MKKIKTISFIMTLFFLVGFMFSCTQYSEPQNESEKDDEQKQLFEYETIETMDAETRALVLSLCYEKYVRAEYPEQTVADLKIDYDMGNRNGNYVFVFSDGREYNDDPQKRYFETVKTVTSRFGEEISYDKIGYYYSDGRPMRVYNGGAVYGFSEAYETGLLSEADMEYFLQCRFFVMNGQRIQKRMDKETENALIDCAIRDVFWDGTEETKNYYHKYKIWIVYYLGTYGNNVVVGLSGGLQSDSTTKSIVMIGDVSVWQDSNYPWFVYNGTSVITLEEAYGNGSIKRDDLLSIAEKAASAELPIYNA